MRRVFALAVVLLLASRAGADMNMPGSRWRNGGQGQEVVPLICGGNGPGDVLALASTCAGTQGRITTAGTLDLWPAITASAGNPTRMAQWTSTLSLTTNDDLVGIALLPTVTINAFVAPNIYGVRATPTITAGALNLATFSLFDGNPTIQSSTATFGHPNSYMYRARPTVTYSGIGNSDCIASGNPAACCTGSGTGTCALTEGSAKLYGIWEQSSIQNTSTSAFTYGVIRDVVSEPAFTASGASGSLTITGRTGLQFSDPTYSLSGSSTVRAIDQIAVDVGTFSYTSGARTVDNVYVIRSALGAGTGGSNAWLIGATGTAPISTAGKAAFGYAALTAPPARLTSSEPTPGTEAFRVETVATNDDPDYRVFQQRAATTNSTTTLLHNFTTASDRAYVVQARVVGRCTSGAGCTAGQAIGCVMEATFKNVSGTVTSLGTANPNCVGDITSLTPATAVAFGAGTAGSCTALTDFCVKVTGATNENITWHTTTIVQDLGS